MRVPKKIYDNKVTIQNRLWKNTSYITFTSIFIKNKHKTHDIKDNLTIKQIFQDQVRHENFLFFFFNSEREQMKWKEKK